MFSQISGAGNPISAPSPSPSSVVKAKSAVSTGKYTIPIIGAIVGIIVLYMLMQVKGLRPVLVVLIVVVLVGVILRFWPIMHNQAVAIEKIG